MKIFKYPVTGNANNEFTASLPQSANILTFQTQNNETYFWAEVDPSATIENRTFRVVGTGQEFKKDSNDRYIGTTQEGDFVWHLYETRA